LSEEHLNELEEHLIELESLQVTYNDALARANQAKLPILIQLAQRNVKYGRLQITKLKEFILEEMEKEDD